MGTCAVTGQAAGTAAALAVRHGVTPREIGNSHLTELREKLLEDDQFIPGLRRTPSALSRLGTPSHALLRDGMDRDWDDGVHGIALFPGESCGYTFQTPVKISGIRLVFDSDLADNKRLFFEEGRPAREMPAILCRKFEVSLQHPSGKWKTIAVEEENRHRLVRLSWPEETATAIRLTARASWGGGACRLFSLDVL